MVDDEDHAPRDSSDGPPIAYSPTFAVPAGDPLLARLNEIHGRDARRRADDLTKTLRGLSDNGRTLALRARFAEEF